MISKTFGSLCFGNQADEAPSDVICRRFSVLSTSNVQTFLSVEFFFWSWLSDE
jgi:hypothetical protein